MCRCRRASCVECRNRKIRKDAVKLALQHGGTVPFEMRSLIEDGWSAATIRKVWRSSRPVPSNGTDTNGKD